MTPHIIETDSHPSLRDMVAGIALVLLFSVLSWAIGGPHDE